MTSPLTPAQQRKQAAKRARNKKIGNVAGGAAVIIWIVFGLMLAVGTAAFFTTDTIPSYGPMTTAHAQRQCVVQAERALAESDHGPSQIVDPAGGDTVEIEMTHIGKNFTATEARDISDDPVFNHRMPITKLYGSRTDVRLADDNDQLSDKVYSLFCVVDMDAAEAAYEAGERDLDPETEIIAHIE